MHSTMYIISARTSLMLACSHLLEVRQLVDRKVMSRYVHFKRKSFMLVCTELTELGSMYGDFGFHCTEILYLILNKM
jgi:hypothetical protein